MYGTIICVIIFVEFLFCRFSIFMDFEFLILWILAIVLCISIDVKMFMDQTLRIAANAWKPQTLNPCMKIYADKVFSLCAVLSLVMEVTLSGWKLLKFIAKLTDNPILAVHIYQVCCSCIRTVALHSAQHIAAYVLNGALKNDAISGTCVTYGHLYMHVCI